MEPTQQNQPLYWDKDRIPVNLTLILALGITAWGAVSSLGWVDMGGNPSIIFALGVVVAIYTWVSTPRQYLIYANALCVVYGKPRVKVIHFKDIDVVEMGSLATVDQLRVRPIKGRRQPIRVRDVEAFYQQLETALNAFRAAYPEYGITIESSREMATEVVGDELVADTDAEAITTDALNDAPTDAPKETDTESPSPEAKSESEDDTPQRPPNHNPLY